MTENIFDLTDISDMPAVISTGLRGDIFGRNILILFNKAGRDLSVDEVTVGYYRQFKKIKTRKQIMLKLCSMAKANKIKSIPNLKGMYGVVK